MMIWSSFADFPIVRHDISSRLGRNDTSKHTSTTHRILSPNFAYFAIITPPPPPPRARVREGKRGERLVDGDGAMLLSSHPEHDLRADVST
jgi:hypothetical protein